MVRPSERDKNKLEKALRLAIKIEAGGFVALHDHCVGVRTIVESQRRLSELEVAQIGQQYQHGKSTYDLAIEWKINRSTVTLALKRAGVPIRRPQLSDSQVEEAASLYARGWSLNRLGQKFGMDPKTVKRRIC